MRNLSLALGISFLIASVSCSVVTTQSPIGSPGETSLSELEGVWVAEDLVVTTKTVAPGRLAVAFLGWDSDSFEFWQGQAYITEVDGHLFLATQLPDTAEDRFFVGEIFIQADALALYPANPSAFRILVESGQLAGTIGDGDIHLTATSEELAELVRKTGTSELFDPQNPVLARRVSGAL